MTLGGGGVAPPFYFFIEYSYGASWVSAVSYRLGLFVILVFETALSDPITSWRCSHVCDGDGQCNLAALPRDLPKVEEGNCLMGRNHRAQGIGAANGVLRGEGFMQNPSSVSLLLILSPILFISQNPQGQSAAETWNQDYSNEGQCWHLTSAGCQVTATYFSLFSSLDAISRTFSVQGRMRMRWLEDGLGERVCGGSRAERRTPRVHHFPVFVSRHAWGEAHYFKLVDVQLTLLLFPSPDCLAFNHLHILPFPLWWTSKYFIF